MSIIHNYNATKNISKIAVRVRITNMAVNHLLNIVFKDLKNYNNNHAKISLILGNRSSHTPSTLMKLLRTSTLVTYFKVYCILNNNQQVSDVTVRSFRIRNDKTFRKKKRSNDQCLILLPMMNYSCVRYSVNCERVRNPVNSMHAQVACPKDRLRVKNRV